MQKSVMLWQAVQRVTKRSFQKKKSKMLAKMKIEYEKRGVLRFTQKSFCLSRLFPLHANLC
jgi:hypothetical protein